MPGSGTVTVTGKVGPGLTLTAGVFTNVSDLHFNFANELVQITQTEPNKITDVDVTAATTITMTVSGATYTVSIS